MTSDMASGFVMVARGVEAGRGAPMPGGGMSERDLSVNADVRSTTYLDSPRLSRTKKRQSDHK
jgi:hypothetical protein